MTPDNPPPAAPEPMHEIDDAINEALLRSKFDATGNHAIDIDSAFALQAATHALIAIAIAQRERLALQRTSSEKMAGIMDSLVPMLERFGAGLPLDVTTTVNPGVGAPPKATDPPADNGAGPA